MKLNICILRDDDSLCVMRAFKYNVYEFNLIYLLSLHKGNEKIRFSHRRDDDVTHNFPRIEMNFLSFLRRGMNEKRNIVLLLLYEVGYYESQRESTLPEKHF